jgi:protein-tyrosine phosphatase
MRELHIDISGHRARQLTGKIVESADLILALSKSHKSYIKDHFPEALNKTYLLSEYADKDGPAAGIADPIGSDKTTYRNCRDEIQKYILMITEKIKH